MKPTAGRRAGTLNNGDHMSQPEFHRRYLGYPDSTKIELIGGIVYMSSPMKRRHGTSSPELSLVLTLYKGSTPGVETANDMTAILDDEAEPQPDHMLRILTEYGGQSRYNEDDFLVGAPEFVAEVADSSRSIDMNRKRLDYLGAGVQEYLVWCLEEAELHWFHFPSKRKLKADREGLWKSRVFPGLWIDGPALLARDTARLVAAVQRGLASAEHAPFVKQLAARRGRVK